MTKTTEHTIDVRIIPPRQKHPAIFGAWNELPDGESLLLLNDHDPLPLYYQFACKFAGQFHWSYEAQGPDIWRVRISKGLFPDPGFVPRKKAAAAPETQSIDFVQPLVLDTRPYFQRGEPPCHAIDEAVATLIPGQAFQLIAPFDPVPLRRKLENEGFSVRSRQLQDGAWQLEFRK
ncbi:MAG: DUF2249 domain-containing protein [Verrucomicrobia bacterium]|nr:DUF2249 domain-containing protein [Verrucomicrobiota bacterium]